MMSNQEIQASSDHLKFGKSYIIFSALTLTSFLLALLCTALLAEFSNIAYLQFCLSALFGLLLAGPILALTLKKEQRQTRLVSLFSALPGWQNIVNTVANLEEQIELLEIKHKTLTDNIAAAIIIRDATGDILYCSPYTEVLTGYAQNEIYEDSDGFFNTIVHPDDSEKFSRSLKVSQLGEAFQFRYRFYHKTGLLMWAETRTVPLLDEQSRLQALLSITFDVTGTMRYQQRVEEHNQDLKDFSYMLSHDLKSPMVTIAGMLTALREDFGVTLEQEALHMLDHAETASKRLQSLIKSVIEYSRVSNLEEKQQLVDCNSLVNEIADGLRNQLSKANDSIIIGDLPTVWGDETMIYQIFLNLISNAIKYRDPERELNITVRATQDSDERMVAIEVQDSGTGIPDELLDDIFRPFSRAHGSEIEGSGIGLACVKKLSERIGGSINVESSLGVGSKFTVNLRRADAVV